VAQALIAARNAEIAHQNGRIRSIRLIATAQTHAQRIGEATPLSAASYSMRFTVRERLECGGIAWRFHRRSFE
jgi:hypothetical protein